MALEHLWAGWRTEYVATAAQDEGCVLCRIVDHKDDAEALVLSRGRFTAVVLNAYPYTSGHLMTFPLRHVAEPEGLAQEESAELWQLTMRALRALRGAYEPDGANLGANLGRVAGAGVPGHFHLHALPRWDGDTNFMTTVSDTRVMPETLQSTYAKLKAAWPS